MARARGTAGPEISLFPFLSILACLIGALTILIVALSVSEVLQGRKDEAVARAEDYVKLEKEMKEREAAVAEREDELRKTNAAAVELAELVPRLATLKQEQKRLEQLVEKREPTRRELEDLKKKREELEKEKNKVEAGLVEGKKELGELAKQLRKGLPLRILSTSDYFRRVAPVFVEARLEGIVVHSPSQTVKVPRAAIRKAAKFKKTVDYVAAKKDRIIVFLVREDARASFYAAQEFARANGAVTSKVPLQGAGELDLKEFFKAR
jgi:predicted RNase H-like nuclease (RuvC/YqgF family)